LPPVAWQAHFNDTDVPPAGEFMVVLHQPVHPEDVPDYLQALDDDYATLDLRQLNIRVQVVGEPERTARLPVWDGVNLRRRNDVFTGRIFMMTITDAVNVQASL
jgi:hypothetical protein